MKKIDDMSGKKLSKMFVTDKFEMRQQKNQKIKFWLCVCDCGNERWIRQSYLLNRIKSGKKIDCGKHPRIDMSGKRFGRITVQDKFLRDGRTTYWWCKCDCGNERWIGQGNIKRMDSCGCAFRERAREKMLGKYGIATKKNIYCDYRKSAKYRGYEFDISFDDFVLISQKNCYYCGDEPHNIEKSKYDNGDFIYNGIDRLDNGKGYVEGNIVPCCSVCNQMKMTLGEKEFLNQISKIFNTRINAGTHQHFA